MRKLIFASAVALGASLTLGASASYADVTVRLGDNDHYHHYHHYHHDHVIGRVDDGYYHHRHHRDCMTKTVVTHRHGDRIVKKTRICR